MYRQPSGLATIKTYSSVSKFKFSFWLVWSKNFIRIVRFNYEDSKRVLFQSRSHSKFHLLMQKYIMILILTNLFQDLQGSESSQETVYWSGLYFTLDSRIWTCKFELIKMHCWLGAVICNLKIFCTHTQAISFFILQEKPWRKMSAL